MPFDEHSDDPFGGGGGDPRHEGMRSIALASVVMVGQHVRNHPDKCDMCLALECIAAQAGYIADQLDMTIEAAEKLVVSQIFVRLKEYR